MIDQAYTYIGAAFDKIKDISAPINLNNITARAGFSRNVLNEYEIITRNSNIPDSSSDEEDDELGYAVAPSVPFPAIRRAMDAVSASEPEFPKLFHQESESLTSDSLSVIQQPVFAGHGPLDAGWVESKEQADFQSVYRKVANWVFSQQKYFPRMDSNEEDDIEVIDPIDLFHDSLLDDFLLLTRSGSEKRILLREFSSHYYNMLTVAEASKSYGHDFLRKPHPNSSFEMADFVGEEVINANETEKPFLSVPAVLQDYTVVDKDGSELVMDENWSPYGNEDENSSANEDQGEIKEQTTNEIDILSLRCSEVLPQSQHSDVCTSMTYPTDAFEITTTVVADNASDSEENDSDIWEDAKAIPHWLDCEVEEHLFSQPHRPIYYYRDRIKGCYRIIGVEDETVVLFSGNDDDSIFYGMEREDCSRADISALRRSHSLGLMNSSMNKSQGTLFSSSIDVEVLDGRKDNRRRHERKNDSGIEDGEDSLLGETMVEKSLSAKECRELGRVTRVIRSKESKTVTFQLEDSQTLISEYLFPIFAIICFSASLFIYIASVYGEVVHMDQFVFAFKYL